MADDRTVPEIDPLQLDIASAVARMEQAYAEAGTPLGELLLMRLATCDAPRLRRHLTPLAAAVLAQEEANGVEVWRTALNRAIEEAG